MTASINMISIDGVLVRGSNPLPKAKAALDLLNKTKVPFILLTNGGGVTEEARVEFLSSKLDVELSPLQIVQSHTPFKALAQKGAYQRVLAVGGPQDKVRNVARNYGFKDVIMPVDIIKADPSVWPFHKYTSEQLEKWASREPVDLLRPIDAVLVFNDPRDMGSDIQIVMDMLNTVDGHIGTKRPLHQGSHLHKPSIPIYFSNNDFYWANDYNLPRFGQGAYRIIIESLYKEVNNVLHLDSTILGKPEKVTYDYAHHVLIDWRRRLLSGDYETPQILPALSETPVDSPFKKIYMVGDNPASDIKGANDNGWDSLLLRTGVFKDEDLPDIVAYPTGGIFDHVEDAVRYGLKQNGLY